MVGVRLRRRVLAKGGLFAYDVANFNGEKFTCR